MQKDTEIKNDYISDKVNDLVSKVGEQYGELLLDELFRRLDNTISDFDTEIKAEAFYLCGVLNSKFIDTKIKPLQPRGDFGPRSIHKLPFDFPIPKFESNNKYHKKISEISLECHRKASKELDGLSSYKSIGVLRSKIRDYLNEELAQIDECVKTIMVD